MTVKDHPRRLFEQVAEAWADDSGEAFVDWVEVPGQPLPDITPGTTNPDEQTTRWEWTTDLTAQEEAAFDGILDRLMAGGTGMPTDAKVDELVATMKAYRNSTPGSPTPAQMDEALRAVIDYLRYLRLLV